MPAENGKTRKYIKIILGIFIVFNIISPFVNASELYNFNTNDVLDEYIGNIITDNVKSKSSIDDKIEELYIRELENDISNTIKQLGYNVTKCEIDAIVYSDNEEAGINKINITISSKKDDYSEYIKDSELSEVNSINQVEIKVDINNKITEENRNLITEKEIKKIKKYLKDYYEIDEKIININ